MVVIPEEHLLKLDFDLRQKVKEIIARDGQKSVVPHGLREDTELQAINQRYANLNAFSDVISELTLSNAGQTDEAMENLQTAIGNGAQQLHQCMAVHEPKDAEDPSKPQGMYASVNKRISSILSGRGKDSDPYADFRGTLATITDELSILRSLCEEESFAPTSRPFNAHRSVALESLLPKMEALTELLKKDTDFLERHSETPGEVFARVESTRAAEAGKMGEVIDLSKYFDKGRGGRGGSKKE